MDTDFLNFEKALLKLSQVTRQNDMSAFTAFLEYCIYLHSFSPPKDFSGLPEPESDVYFNVYREYILLQYNKLKRLEWFDPFGTYFEMNSSKFSRDRNGQFFTPLNVCNFMVEISVNKEVSGKNIYDLACGSGRLLLASHVYNPKNFHFGQDIDYTCCLMSCVNMMMHGIQGEVVWGNSLDPDSYFGGWAINPNIRELKGIPNITSLKKENSLIFQISQRDKKEKMEEIEALQSQAEKEIKEGNFLEVDEENKLDFSKGNDTKTSFDFF